MTKKRILMLNYEFPPVGGGGGVASYKLAKGFVNQGYEVDYVTSWFKNLKKKEVIDGITIHRVYVPGRKELPTATMISLLLFPWFTYAKTASLCKKHDYDFINTQFAVPTGPLGVMVSKRFGLKNILSLHGGDIYDPSKKNSPHKKWYFRMVVNWVLKNSTIVAAQSTNTSHNTNKYYNVDKPINIIPLPYDKISYKKVSKKSLGLDPKNKYLISIGRVVARKDFRTLIKALKEIKDKNVHALIIGEGPEKEELKHFAKELGLDQRVHFLGFVSQEEKFQYLSLSDVYVMSSLHEGFGIVLQEAMQEGLPIVSTNNGGQVDFIKHGETGFLVSVGDYKAIANSITKILSDKKLINKFKKNISIKNKEFASDSITKQYLKLQNE